MRLVAEFTSEPFHGEGDPPPHAVAALRAVEDAGLDVEFGPLGTTVSGDADEVVQALADVLRSTLSHGATRVTLQVAPADDGDPEAASLRRPPGGARSLEELIDEVAAEVGAPLAELPRAAKQRAVRLLEERGAFGYRRSAETIAEALAVSRFTVYNYLNRSR